MITVSLTQLSKASSSNSSVFNTEQQTVQEHLGTVSHALKMHENHVNMVKLVHHIISLGYSVHVHPVLNVSSDSENEQYHPNQYIIIVIIS